MTRPYVRVIDGDLVVDRQMNDDEYAQYLADQEMFELERQANVQKESARQTLLQRLGITDEEARMLLQ